MMDSRELLYVFSPMPPSFNGIADYSYDLIEKISAWYRVICVISDDAPEPNPVGRLAFLYYSQYRHISEQAAQQRHLFQIGNNSGHAYMLPVIEQVSGVITIHDAALPHMLEAAATSSGRYEAFLDIIETAHGLDSRRLAQDAMAGGLWFGAMAQEFDCLAIVAARARSIVVHSNLAYRRVKAAWPKANVYLIPHYASSTAMRDIQPFDVSQPVRLLCFGFAGRAKRLDLVLAALAHHRAQGLDVRLTIAGQIRPEEEDVEAQVATLGLGPWVTMTGYVAEHEIDTYLQNADLVINLRDPTSGESSGTVARALSAGCCVVVSDVGAYAELPDEVVVKIPVHAMTVAAFADKLEPWLKEPTSRARVGRQAASYAKTALSIDKVAADYAAAIEQSYATAPPRLPQACDITGFLPIQATSQVTQAARERGMHLASFQLWWRERLLPLGDGQRLAILGSVQSEAELASAVFGWNGRGAPQGVLALMDEQNLLSPGEGLTELWDLLFGHEAPRHVTIEVEHPCQLPELLITQMRMRGYVLLREARVPELPLLLNEPVYRVENAWCGTFALLACGELA